MTVPVSMLNKQVDEETMEQEMSFYVDANHQENPPKPNNPNLYITTRPELTVYTRYKYTQFRFIYRVFRLRIRFLKGFKMSKKQYVDKKIRQQHNHKTPPFDLQPLVLTFNAEDSLHSLQ